MWYEIFAVWTKIYAINIARYLLFSGVAYLFFYVIFKNRFAHKRIQKKDVEKEKIKTEFIFSIMSLMIFACMGIVVFLGNKAGIFHIYKDISEYGLTYFIFSIITTIILHDTYFYWTHRFMHLKWVFPRVHKVHHLSNNPSPWAAFSFHPSEAIFESAILPLVLLMLPMHSFAILIFLLYMTGMNVMGHLGYEMFPKGFLQNPLGRLYNTSLHHNMHHRLVNCNYGLYFNVWDLIMKTNHSKYQEEFERVASTKRK